MFKYYFLLILRTNLRSKSYSIINIITLAVGMSCFLLMLLYYQFENNFDNFHKNGSDIYRIYSERSIKGDVDRRGSTGPVLAPKLAGYFPEILNAVRFYRPGDKYLVSNGNAAFSEKNFMYSDNSIFKVFTFPLTSGDARNALTEPFSIVISQNIVGKYFGNKNPLGENLIVQVNKNNYTFKITGIMKEIPANSHLQFDFLASFLSLKQIKWTRISCKSMG